MNGYYNRLVDAKEKYGDRVVACDGKESLRSLKNLGRKPRINLKIRLLSLQ